MPAPSGPSVEEIAARVALVGAQPADPLVDGVLLPNDAARAVEAFASAADVDATLLVRVHPPVGAVEEGWGAAPVPPTLLRLARAGGALTATRAPLRGPGDVEPARFARVVVARASEPCCALPGCAFTRAHVEVWVELEGGARLLASEGRPLEGQPDDGATRFARALAAALAVPLEDGPTDGASDAPRADDADEIAVASASQLARYAARSEGDRFVLRDHAGEGPRLGASTQRVVAIGLAALAVGFWAPAVEAAIDHAGGRAAAFGSVATLLSIAAFAFSGIARFASAYAASSTPLAWFGAGRFVVAPWVSRGGAIDLRLEGQLGAAIPCAEVTGVDVITRGDDEGTSVFIDSDHGAIDVVAVGDPALAALLGKAVRRAIELAKHPSAQPSARQRARAKQGEADANARTSPPQPPSPSRERGE
ncbi:MAG TPA: hypothetical protein VGM56_08510 [Byssovorax sp.]|jgi:hypothetical protein